MKTECLVCAGATVDVWLCLHHTQQLRVMLRRVPDLARDLETSRARLDRVVHTVGGHAKGGAAPAIVNFDAGAMLAELRRWLLQWSHFACDRYLTRLKSFSIPDMAVCLHQSVAHIITTQDAGFMYLELDDLVRRIVHTIDLPLDRSGWDYAGPCGMVFDNGTCPNQLWVRHGETLVTCARCGTGWDVADRRGNALEKAVNLHATASAISRALTASGRGVTSELIYQWHRRGKLKSAGTNKAGQPLYRVGDVMKLTKEQK